MDFHEALDQVFKGGNKVTRTSWNNSKIFLSLMDAKLCITGFSHPTPDDGKAHPLIIDESDFFADDWRIVE